MNNRSDIEAAPRTQRHHHRKNHDAEDVIQNSGADHDLTLAGTQIAQFSKHAGRNTNAGGRHRCPRKNGRNGIHMEEAHQAKGSQGKGEHYAHHCHREGLLPYGHQFIQLTFQSRKEQQ